MVLSPSALFSAVALIALAAWFPVTMLTASRLSNSRTSYLDVARTLGRRSGLPYLPGGHPAAMPSIFLGLFMGLGASFLTLVVRSFSELARDGLTLRSSGGFGAQLIDQSSYSPLRSHQKPRAIDDSRPL
jgi:ABC-type nitrate/sulfonate/bicarbonate transport system permease component